MTDDITLDITEEPRWVYRDTAYNTKAQAERMERYHLSREREKALLIERAREAGALMTAEFGMPYRLIEDGWDTPRAAIEIPFLDEELVLKIHASIDTWEARVKVTGSSRCCDISDTSTPEQAVAWLRESANKILSSLEPLCSEEGAKEKSDNNRLRRQLRKVTLERDRIVIAIEDLQQSIVSRS